MDDTDRTDDSTDTDDRSDDYYDVERNIRDERR
jgi:hypothetical protein